MTNKKTKRNLLQKRGGKTKRNLLQKRGGKTKRNLLQKRGGKTKRNLVQKKRGGETEYTEEEKLYLEQELLKRVASGDVEDVKEFLKDHEELLRKNPNLKRDYLNIGLETIQGDNVEMAEFLLDQGADINSQMYDFTPLFYAVVSKKVNLTKYLLEKGADTTILYVKEGDIADTNITVFMKETIDELKNENDPRSEEFEKIYSDLIKT